MQNDKHNDAAEKLVTNGLINIHAADMMRAVGFYLQLY